MKRSVKTGITIILSILMLWCGCSSVFASDIDAGVAPCWENTHTASMSFVVVDPGVANFVVSYIADPDTFAIAKLTVTFEKRYLGVFWRTVDIGTENNEWVDYCGDQRGDFIGNVTLDGTGTYRANFQLIVYSAETADVIEKTMSYQY